MGSQVSSNRGRRLLEFPGLAGGFEEGHVAFADRGGHGGMNGVVAEADAVVIYERN